MDYHDFYNCIGVVHFEYNATAPCVQVTPSAQLSDGESVQISGLNYSPSACEISNATAGSDPNHTGCVPQGSTTNKGFTSPWYVKVTECTFQMLTLAANRPNAYTNFCDLSTLKFAGRHPVCADVQQHGSWGACTVPVHKTICPGEAPCAGGQGGINCTDDPATNPITAGDYQSNFKGSYIDSMCVLLAGSYSGDTGGGHYLFFPGGKDYLSPLGAPPPPPTTLPSPASCTIPSGSPGTIVAWGYNGAGQLGDDATDDCPAATAVSSLSDATALAAGDAHSLALDNSGHVWAWGLGSSGQLGNGSTNSATAPQEVLGASGVGHLGDAAPIVAIAAGLSHSLALDSAGHVWAWGDDTYGELGDGHPSSKTDSHTSSRLPEEVLGPGGTGVLEHIVSIAAGAQFSLASDSGGHAWAWGQNLFGQLGNGSQDTTGTAHTTPSQVLNADGTALGSVVRIAAGPDSSTSFALTTTGHLLGWGADPAVGDGTQGDGPGATAGSGQTGFRWVNPVLVNVPAPLMSFNAGQSSIAIMSAGGVYGWGSALAFGGVHNVPNLAEGDAAAGEWMNPQALPEAQSIVAAAGSNFFQAFVRNNGTVLSWGAATSATNTTPPLGHSADSECPYDYVGQLGTAHVGYYACALQLAPVITAGGSPLTDATTVVSGNGFFLALIGRAPTTVSTSVIDAATGASWTGAEQAGASAADTATVGGQQSGTPATGTVTYSLFRNATCAGTSTSTQTLTLNPDGTAPNSNATGALAAGHYAYKASYSGDANYRPASGPCEPFTVQLPISVSVGYVDNVHLGASGTYTGPFAPSPWQGSPATIFVGCNRNVSGHPCTDVNPSTKKACPSITGAVPQDCYDAGAIRIANATGTAIPLTRITVNIGGCTFNPWAGEPSSVLTVPAHGQLILTQTGGLEPNTGCGFGPDPETPFNFDTSDTSPGGSCSPTGYIPTVSLTTALGTFLYHDTGQVLNHRGVDASCTSKNANERTNWAAVTS